MLSAVACSGLTRARSCCTDLHIGCPEGEVVTQQLHDERAVLVGLLAQGVELSDGLIKGLQAGGSQ